MDREAEEELKEKRALEKLKMANTQTIEDNLEYLYELKKERRIMGELNERKANMLKDQKMLRRRGPLTEEDKLKCEKIESDVWKSEQARKAADEAAMEEEEEDEEEEV